MTLDGQGQGLDGHVLSLDGQVAVVTGGSRGIGRATALELARHGARVVVNYLANAEAARQTVDLVVRAGGEAVAVQADVRDLDAIRRLTDVATEQFGRISILVNNAGILREKLLTFVGEDDWHEVVDTTLTAAFLAIKVIGRDMARRRTGAIINVSSVAGQAGDLQRAGYCAAKAGLDGLTRAAAREFAASNVRVNAVAPGIIQTDMTADIPEARTGKLLARIPLARFGQAEEVARLIRFLASDDAAYITGQVIRVDGGLGG